MWLLLLRVSICSLRLLRDLDEATAVAVADEPAAGKESRLSVSLDR